MAKILLIDIRRRLNSGIGRVIQWIVNNITESLFAEGIIIKYLATSDSCYDYLDKTIIVNFKPFSYEELYDLPKLLLVNNIDLFINPQVNCSPFIITPTITVIHDTWYLLNKDFLPNLEDINYRFDTESINYLKIVSEFLNDELTENILSDEGKIKWQTLQGVDILSKYFWSQFAIVSLFSKHIVFVSPKVEKNFLTLFKRKKGITMIENDFKSDWMNTSSIDKKDIFLCLAKLEKRKNIEYAVNSFVKYCKITGDKTTTLLIAGDKGYLSYSNMILNKIHLLKKDGFKVEYVGSLNDKRLNELFARTRALISATEYESFGLPVFESISQGIPTFSTKTGMITQVLDENNKFLFFDHNNEDSLANLLIDFNEKESKYLEEFTLMQKKLIEYQNTKIIKNKWSNLIKQIINEKGSN